MIYELRTYTLVPGAQAQFVKQSVEVGRPARGDNHGKLEGYWTTEFGTLNQVVHLWSFPGLDERTRLRAALAQNEAWTKGYLPMTQPLLLAQENKILSAAVPMTPPADSGNVYELRWYRTHVGKTREWIEHFKAILPLRDQYMRRVGVWQTEMGQLNEVVHLWAFKDLNERAAARARLGQAPEWQAFLKQATPLLAHMQSIVLLPAPHSPMK